MAAFSHEVVIPLKPGTGVTLTAHASFCGPGKADHAMDCTHGVPLPGGHCAPAAIAFAFVQFPLHPEGPSIDVLIPPGVHIVVPTEIESGTPAQVAVASSHSHDAQSRGGAWSPEYLAS
jgi:hypothetical protein